MSENENKICELISIDSPKIIIQKRVSPGEFLFETKSNYCPYCDRNLWNEKSPDNASGPHENNNNF